MPAKRSRLPVLLTVAVLSTLIGAGSVFAAMSRPSTPSALTDFDHDSPALKAADLDRTLAAGGASPDRVVITYADGFADQTTLTRVHELVGGTSLSGDGALGREVIRVTSGDAASAVARVQGLAGVAEVRVERALSVEAGLPAVTNDPYAAYAWGVTRIGANQVWGTSTGGGVRVAVLDCGIHGSHPDLAGQVVLEKNFTASATADDRCNHGTHVAGAIAALTNNGLGVPSVAPGVRLMNGKVLDDAGHGFSADVENGLRWAADNGARVVNLSLGGDSPCAASTLAAVTYARARGVVIVAAAGNSGLSRAATPANCPGVVAVGAVDQNDARPSWSNAGPGVALAAPGVSIGSPVNPEINNGALYGLGSGTSIASPHVAGVAALLWSSSYGTSADAVISRLESTADHIGGTGSLWTYGRVSALQAVGAPVATASATPTAVPATATAIPTQVPATATALPATAPASVATALPVKPASGAIVPPTPRPTWTPVATRVPATPTQTVPRLSAPTTVNATASGHGQVQVSWQAAVDSRTTFNVYRGDSSGLDMRLLAAGIQSSTQVFVDRTPPIGQIATYSVAAQNAAGEGPHSPPVRTTSIIR